jgi:hypothetical protein
MSRDSQKTYERERKQRLRKMSRDKDTYLLTNTISKKESLSRDKESSEGFERFWLAYPRRKGSNPKHPARLKFSRAVKSGVDPEAIISGAKNYAQEACPGTEFICMAVTWLNQRRWEDYAPTAEIVSLTPERRAEILAKLKRQA